MQKTFSFFWATIALLVIPFMGAAAMFLANSAQAQIAIAGHPKGPAITAVDSKGAGEAQVTITGVQLKSSLSYCLIGVGRGNWYGTATKVQIEKIGCTKAESGKVIVPIRLEAKRYETNGSIIGYVPIVIDATGIIIDWPQKPVGSQEFERTNGKKDQIIPIVWSTAGIAQLATAEQAMTIND